MNDLQGQLDSLRSRRSKRCVSDYEIDRLLLGDLAGAEAAEVQSRIDACAHCQQRATNFRDAQQRFSERPAPIWLGRSGRRNTLGVVATIAAVAAAALLFVQPVGEEPGVIRLKGSHHFGYLVVASDGTVRGDQDFGLAAPGDELQWRFRTSTDAYVAVLSRDPSGNVSTYYPEGPRTVLFRGGPERVLPLAVKLDASLGQEVLFGLICEESISLEPILAALKNGIENFPTACAVQAYSLTKKAGL